ncbi:stage III sporulation protein AF [Allobacillus sp. SKP2-8]|uniref:stage III sporulation protein AF n=1 Tax=unclassified Allobacillus TaxID=2628859 RepID=UPI00118397D9|nr:stage III sporulation protein AF [Allobacillus sp. SKP2-8]TSJ68930.1 stage III sporulation protein AF [Allobacillus sp. SKP2-8]
MSFLMNWVSQIVLFIFLATIVSLLIPKNSHEKVIKLVFGLIVFLLFLHPLKMIFQVEPDQIISQIQLEEFLQGEKDIEKEISDKKIEIQASTDAYILEQLEKQVENTVGEELMATYGVSVQDITIQMKENATEEEPQMDEVTFRLAENKQELIEPIEDVSIPASNHTDRRDRDIEIAQSISSLLDLPLQAVEIEWEGG